MSSILAWRFVSCCQGAETLDTIGSLSIRITMPKFGLRLVQCNKNGSCGKHNKGILMAKIIWLNCLLRITVEKLQ